MIKIHESSDTPENWDNKMCVLFFKEILIYKKRNSNGLLTNERIFQICPHQNEILKLKGVCYSYAI